MTLEIKDAEKYTDEIDRASAITDAYNEACIDHARQAMKPQQEPDENGVYPFTDCVDCGDEIPVERLKMGRVRCTICQEILERKGRIYARHST